MNESMSRKNIIEEAYVLKKLEDNKNIRHKQGTNEYVFDYNYQWRNIYNQHQCLAIRSVKIWKSPRYIWIDSIPLIRPATEEEMLLPGHEGKTEFHELVDVNGIITGTTYEGVKHITTSSPYLSIKYNILTKKLTFEVQGGGYINTEILNKTTESDDFKAITGKKFSEGTPGYGGGKVIQMIFDNVWDREDIHVYASFSDLSSDGFLGVSDEQFIPPKQYPVNNNDQKFKLFLYDKLDRPIELAIDGKDALIVEAMMVSYT